MTIVFKSDYKIQEQIGPDIVDLSVINMYKIFWKLGIAREWELKKGKESSKGEKEIVTKIGW